jgi:hypothetical protein
MMSSDDREARFSRAVVATRYLLGDRGDELGGGVIEPTALAFSRALANPDQATRVRALAREVAQIAFALDRGGLG